VQFRVTALWGISRIRNLQDMAMAMRPALAVHMAVPRGGAQQQARRLVSTGLRTSTGIVPQDQGHLTDGTNTNSKTLDVWDTLARLVGPRPDTVTTDNLRSSRSESETRRFNPGYARPAGSAP
jgi:hypothetical protein